MKIPFPPLSLRGVGVGRFPARKAPRIGRRILGLGLMAAAGIAAGRADDTAKAPPVEAPAEAELRAGIARGLDFLAREGDEWMEARNCNSCHHLPELLWSHREAGQRGFAVDPKKFDEWLGWSLERAAEKKAGVEEIALLVLALPERPAPELAQRLAAAQKADGSWNPGNQFATMQKRGEPDARIGATRLSLSALSAPQAAAPESDAARARAGDIDGLQDKTPSTSMESLVFRLSHARSIGRPGEADALVEEILGHQRGDGGWSSVLGANRSDPLATGQALYALQPAAAEPRAAASVTRAQRWLLGAQREDGSWPIDITHISKVDRSAPEKAKSFKEATEIYTFWGTSWATIGLLQGVPASGIGTPPAR